MQEQEERGIRDETAKAKPATPKTQKLLCPQARHDSGVAGDAVRRAGRRDTGDSKVEQAR